MNKEPRLLRRWGADNLTGKRRTGSGVPTQLGDKKSGLWVNSQNNTKAFSGDTARSGTTAPEPVTRP